MLIVSSIKSPLQMILPCMFYRLVSKECALSRYGQGSKIRDAIKNTLESILRGVIKKRAQNSPSMDINLSNLAQYIETKYIENGLENPVENITCFGLLRSENQYVCGQHNLWFSQRFNEVIPFLQESSEGTYGCLCYLAALVSRNTPQEPDILKFPLDLGNFDEF